jgi:ABC-type multidrug transport system ATPase subunit
MQVLKVEKVNKVLKNKKILNNISFEVETGEVYGFL